MLKQNSRRVRTPLFRRKQSNLSKGDLTSANRCSEDVLIKGIIRGDLELCNVKWHVFLADFVERVHHAALDDRPEAFKSYSCERHQRHICASHGHAGYNCHYEKRSDEAIESLRLARIASRSLSSDCAPCRVVGSGSQWR